MPEYMWTPERLLAYGTVTGLDLAPTGEAIALAVREPLMTEDESRFISQLYWVPFDGGEPYRLTYGPHTHDAPHWSPDGQYLAFLSDRGGKKDLWVLRRAGGEAWQLTRQEKGVRRFAWSPDGRQIAFIGVAADDEARKTALRAKDDPLVWGQDFERAQLWVIRFTQGDEPLPTPAPVTETEIHVVQLAWAEDGRSLAFAYQPSPSADDWPATRLAVAPVGTQLAPRRELAELMSGEPSLWVHGDWVACATGDPAGSWIGRARVTLHSLTGQPARPLAVTPDENPFPVGWSRDGQAIYVLERDRTCSALLRLPVDGGAPTPLTAIEGFASLLCTDGGDRLAWVGQTSNRAEYVCTLEPAGPAREVCVVPQRAWPAAAVPATEVLRWRSDDGLELEALLTLPPGRAAGARLPLVVMVHGGPTGVYSEMYTASLGLYPVASFAERGYAVLRVNPRGSGGYGYDFRAANWRDWGGGDYRDILRGVDECIARGIADPQRLGIMGWSYGGFMTSWAITQSQRFRAASVGAGVTNLISFTGTSDIPGFLPSYFGAEFWRDAALYARHSSVFQICGVQTPTLIQHGDRDERVPLSQGRELYNALKRQGVPVELVIYPRQTHGPDEPRLVRDIIQRNLDWFARWLPA